jgi:serine phosphatase RsbU (regulator of sigma subunit)
MQLRTRSSWWTSRLIAWLLVLAMAILAAVAVLMYTAYQRAASTLVIERDQQVALLSAARLSEEMASHAELLTALARTPDLYRADLAAKTAALQDARFRLAAFDAGTVLLDNFGTVRAAQPAQPTLIGQDWSDTAFFQQLLASSDVAISDALGDEASGMVMVVSVPLIDGKGQLVGALAGMFGLGESTVSSFYASIVRLRLGQTGTTYVVDGNHRILYDSSYSQVGEILDLAALPDSTGQGVGGAGRTTDADGNDIVAAYAPVPRTNWTLVTEDDWETLTVATRRYARLFLALLIIGPLLPTVGVALLTRTRSSERAEREKRQQETRMAQAVRQKLLPQYVPMLPGYELSVYHRPGGTAAGDFYDYQILPDGRLMLAVGEVADGSVTAALVTATARATLRGATHLRLSPAAALSYSNELLSPELEQGQAVTCLYAILDPGDGRLTFANAGQPLARHRGNGDPGDLQPTCQALGLAPDATYEQGELVLVPGECVLLGSSGVLSTHNGQGEPFGMARLQSLLEQEMSCGQSLVDGLAAALEGFADGGGAMDDDVTLVALARTETGEEA